MENVEYIVTNSSPLINFSYIKKLNLIKEVLGDNIIIIIPKDVQNEIIKEPAKSEVKQMIENNIFRLWDESYLEDARVKELSSKLLFYAGPHTELSAKHHRAECAVMRIAELVGTRQLLLDDKPARQLASEEKFVLTNSKAVLYFALKKNLISFDDYQNLKKEMFNNK